MFFSQEHEPDKGGMHSPTDDKCISGYLANVVFCEEKTFVHTVNRQLLLRVFASFSIILRADDLQLQDNS